ncbi:hypothetical protein RI367_007822 [Sorochytrium milnesiophthora]
MYYILKHFFKNVVYASPLLRSFYKLWKYVKGIATDTSELYRICREDLANQRKSGSDAVGVDAVADIEQVVQMILLKKRFPGNGSLESPSGRTLYSAMSKIHNSYKLVYELNSRAATKFDTTNKHHEKKLLELWDMLMPDEPLEARFTAQWQKIGFQDKDPSTDFRGMGMLALDDLHYFAKHHPAAAMRVLAGAQHPVSWYCFGIAGINITAFALQTVRTRRLQYYLFTYGADKQVYHEFFCYLFYTFNEFWTSRSTSGQPLTVMDFEQQLTKFKALVEQDLIIRKKGMRLSETKVKIQ